MIGVFLAGEGASELGSRNGDPVHQTDEQPGVLQNLLRAVRPDGWHVVGSINWKDIRKLRVNAPDEGDALNVHRASFHAGEKGATALAFVRDRDRNASREEAVERAIAAASKERPVAIVGGVATESVEAWLIALTGEQGSERKRHPEKEMVRIGLVAKSAVHYAAHVEKCGIGTICDDADSLKLWVTRAHAALSPAADDG